MNFDPESLKVKGGHGIAKEYSILHVYITSYHFGIFFYWVKVCRMKAGYA